LNTQNITVLLIEDNAVIRTVHKTFLEKLGCTVSIASQGKEALEMLENHYDIIFMDIGLPDIHGAKLVHQIRNHPKTKRPLPIIAITGYSKEKDLQSFLESGFDEIATKPVLLEKFEALLQKYCKSHALN